MDKHLVPFFIIFLLFSLSFAGCLEFDSEPPNTPPTIHINHPLPDATVSRLVIISGTTDDADGADTIKNVELSINDGKWTTVDGTTHWSYEWNILDKQDGQYTIQVRVWDNHQTSTTETITVKVDNPDAVESDTHKWAVFVAAANFPENNDSKLGNGGLYLAEEMAAYLIEECNYATSNIFILFDDGWIREDNGRGKRLETLQERRHTYDVVYGAATKNTVINTFNQIITESNRHRDSEVFIWMFNHGYGDLNNSLTGGKLFESSQIFLWDPDNGAEIVSDKDLGEWLAPLQSKKMALIVDACFCGGFADKTILNIRTPLIFRSDLPKSGRIIIAGTSKYRAGFASTTQGPIFTFLWFHGLQTGEADGYRNGILNIGNPRYRMRFQDGKVSVEEAFYYAQYHLRTDANLEQFKAMEPQINDRYPYRGLFRNNGEMILGE